MSSASSSGCPRVVSEDRDGNLDQSAILKGSAFSAPGNKEVSAGSVKEELAVRPRWARPFYVPSSDMPNLVSHLCDYGRPPIELRMLGSQWISAEPVSNEFSAWYKPNPVLSRSLSWEVCPPSVGDAPRSASVGEDDDVHVDRLQFLGLDELVHQFDDILIRFYGYPNNGRQLFLSCTPLYNTFVGKVPASGLSDPTSFRFRNLGVGKPAIVDKLHVGEVVRFRHSTFIHNLRGRKTDTWCSTLHVENCHHVGRNCFALGCNYNPRLPRYCRIVWIDTCKLKWRSVGSVAFHSFAWPRNVKEANGIARTLFTNHCDWADMLIVRGRCSSAHKVCFRANRPLENLLWNWSQMRRPYVVYREGNDGISDIDLAPAWLTHECVYKDFCQCHLVGSSHKDWHRPGSLNSNVVGRRRRLFEKQCGCSHVQWSFPNGCNKNSKNSGIAIQLSRAMIHVLRDVLPSVPQRGEPLVFVLRTKELKLKLERGRTREQRRRVVRRGMRQVV